MTVDLATLVSTTEDFQQQQIEAFEQYIDDSKEMLSGVDSVEKQAEENFETMDSKIQSVVDAPTSGSDEAPVTLLKYNDAYTQAMDAVNIELGENPDTESFDSYIDQRAEQITELMDKRQKST
jgi:hypothetical protein